MENQIDNCRFVSNVSQTDTDGDGIGDACDDCRTLPDPAQVDADHDGTGNRCDCAPYDASTAGLGEALNLRFDADRITLRWEGVVGADRYDLSRGLVSSLDGSDYGACWRENAARYFTQDTDLPPAGQSFYYLVRADDAVCGPGTLGRKGSGAERINTNPSACAP